MMGKEIEVDDFLKSMRIASINAGVYRENHPVFNRSINNLAKKLQVLLFARDSIEIGFKPYAVVIDGKIFDQKKLYQDIAHFFHQRKIKAVRINFGITKNELSQFFLEVCIPPQKIYSEGGVAAILRKKDIQRIKAYELDYSPLLGSKEKGIEGDAWGFLLDNLYLLEQDDIEKNQFVQQLRNTFDAIDLTEKFHDIPLLAKLKKAVQYLKNKWLQKKCIINQELLRAILRKRMYIKNELLMEEINSLIKDIDFKDALDVLWDEVFEEHNFDPVVFGVFTELIGKDRSDDILPLWHKCLEERSEILKDPSIRKSLRDVLVIKEADYYIPKMYSATLAFLTKSLAEEDTLILNDDDIYRSGLYVALNILESEKNVLRSVNFIDVVLKEWKKTSILSDGNFLKSFLEIVENKINVLDSVPVRKMLNDKKKEILAVIEEQILEKNYRFHEDDFAAFLRIMDTPSFNEHHYAQKIIENADTRAHTVKMFFKYFPRSFPLLCHLLKEHMSHMRLVTKVIESMEGVDSVQAFHFLKKLYSFSNPLVKVEILKKMKHLSSGEEDFFIRNLRDGDPFIKKETIKLLKTQAQEIRKRGVRTLLLVFNPLGIYNNVLIENIRFVSEEQLKDAEEVLNSLLKRRFLWGGEKIKKEIHNALSKLREIP